MHFYFLNISCRKKFGSISDIQNFGQEDHVITSPTALGSMESELPSSVRLEPARPQNRQRSMDVVDVRVKMQSNLSNEEGRRRNYVFVTIPDNKDGAPRWMQRQPGQPGSFFSIHSTNQQPVNRVYDVSHKETKCCLCCTVTVASIHERWSPYKPGDN